LRPPTCQVYALEETLEKPWTLMTLIARRLALKEHSLQRSSAPNQRHQRAIL